MKLDELKRPYELWHNVTKLLRAAAPALSLLVILTTILEALVSLLALYAVKLLVDWVGANLTADANTSPNTLFYVLFVTSVIFALSAFFQSVASILRMRQGLLVSDYVDGQIHERAISVGLKYYESPDYYDALERAREGGSRRPAEIVANALTTFRAVVTLTGILVLIGSIEARLLPILLIPIVIALVLRLRFARSLFEWRMSRAQSERRANYLDLVMTKAYHAKDLRINNLGSYLSRQYRELRTDLRRGELSIEQARMWSEFATSLLGVCIFVAASTWLLLQSMDHGRPIGDVVLFVLLLRRAEGSGKEFVGNISKIVDDHLYLERLFHFLSVPAQSARTRAPKDVPVSHSVGLEMSNVFFRYGGSESDALKDVSLTLHPGKVVALVGENGSGKTTLIKLLTGLYDPSVGKVEIGGVDLRDLDPDEFRKTVSVVFQDYAIYADTAANNIKFGDVEAVLDDSLVHLAARNAGASDFIEALPESYNSKLTKLFDDGHDLSIGQWQRVALARALYSRSKFLILDEPTSAMDPKAEFDLFENFRERIGGRAALIISHRLSTVRQADYIYVMSNGRILESGTHDELVSLSGLYFQLFQKQAESYK